MTTAEFSTQERKALAFRFFFFGIILYKTSIYFYGDKMLSFYIKNIKVGVSFSFFAVLALIFIWQGGEADKLAVILFCCTIHELGHVIMMCLCSVPPKRIIAYGGGIKIYPDKSKMISEWQDILILSAGCIVNFSAAFITFCLNQEVTYFLSANLFLGIFNVMPLKYFDGGQILSVVLNDSPVVKVIRLGFIAMFGAVMIGMFLNGFFSISLVVTYVYIIFAEFFQ